MLQQLTVDTVGTSLPLFELYLLAFGAAAIACFGSLPRAYRIKEQDTRRGLVALLATSGTWATLHIGYLAAPTPSLQYGFYMIGLVVGLSTVGPWLYFCSAYTGRSLHHNTAYQRVAIGIYLGIVAIKLTNPLHGLYFSASVANVPFQHLMIDHGTIHWLAMGLAYSLALVGIFMLFELFTQVDYDTKPFVVLVALTSLPVVFDIAGYVSTALIDITYSAIGVAIFAVGVLFMYTDEFESIQLAGQYDDPVIVLSEDREVRDANRAAEALFPELADATGEELESILPQLDAAVATDEIFKLENGGDEQYYQPATNQFSASRAQLGKLVVLTDVTEQERYRQQLERQNERLEQFTGMVSHDLRNPLNVAQGNSEIIAELLTAAKNDDGSYEPVDSDTLGTIGTAADTLTRTLTRMEILIDDLLVLAREGQEIDETEPVSLAKIGEGCWSMVDQKGAEFVVVDDLIVEADPDRLQQLFENLFRNAIEHGGDEVTIRIGPLDDEWGFYVEDTGPGIPEGKRDTVFESGYTTNRDGTGFGLSIVSEIVEAHGWRIDLAESVEGGARFEITIDGDNEGVADTEETEPTDEPSGEAGRAE
ncbi:histidine kinase [Halonotius terrestris]|uniref:histidine kinase n=1 Tax=Halonotius terrestris TaxID=2487750 RepID=A0A8J8PBK0_9EURY|nr:ATP-binding protein [Halonotius terrestris]TQQ83523.1 histidine kinase [Halonotius terrestris]